MTTNFPQCPASLKPIMHYLKIAAEHDERNAVIAYWCRLHALQVGIKLSAGRKNREETNLLSALMDWLEVKKKELSNNEAITNDMCAQATIEEYVLKIFKYADEQDRAENFNKNLVKAFYTCGIVMDVLSVFGELPDDILEKQKYAKWKAAYIHNCLRNGERPIPGPIDGNADGIPYNDGNNYPNTNVGFIAPFLQPSEDDISIRPSSPTPSNPSPRNSPPANIPTGFQPFVPAPSTSNNVPTTLPVLPAATIVSSEDSLPSLSPEQVTKVKKYCKFASSALDYDDSKTAVVNLQKALALLQTGRDHAS